MLWIMSDSLPATPEAPSIDRELLIELVKYAHAQSRSAQADIDAGIAHGHSPHPQALKNVEGWAFTALALTETYDL
jgi:hypothetical protein